jgi:cell division protease FtsH
LETALVVFGAAVSAAALLFLFRRRSRRPPIPPPSQPTSDEARSAVHEAGHVLLAWDCAHVKSIERVTIRPKDPRLGGVTEVAFHPSAIRNEAAMRELIVIYMAGRAAEEELLGFAGLGVLDDYVKALRLALCILAKITVEEVETLSHEELDRRLAAYVDALTERNVNTLLLEGLLNAKLSLHLRRRELLALSRAIAFRKTLYPEDIAEIIGKRHV